MYKPIDPKVWVDKKFRDLSRPAPNAQTLWFFLLCGNFTTVLPGLYHIGPMALAEYLGWPVEQMERCLRELEDAKMLGVDRDAHVIFLLNALKHPCNWPRNQNQLQGWSTLFNQIPDSPLKNEYFNEMEQLTKRLGKQFHKVFLQRFRQISVYVSVSVSVKSKRGSVRGRAVQKSPKDALNATLPSAPKPNPCPSPPPSKTDAHMAFAEFWEEYPPATNDQGQRVSRSNRARTRDLFFKLVKSGIKPEELIQAARNYAYEKRDDLRYVMGAQRFLGRERWFEQFMGESGPAEEPVAETGPLDPFNPEERARLEAKMSGGHDQEADES